MPDERIKQRIVLFSWFSIVLRHDKKTFICFSSLKLLEVVHLLNILFRMNCLNLIISFLYSQLFSDVYYSVYINVWVSSTRYMWILLLDCASVVLSAATFLSYLWKKIWMLFFFGHSNSLLLSSVDTTMWSDKEQMYCSEREKEENIIMSIKKKSLHIT